MKELSNRLRDRAVNGYWAFCHAGRTDLTRLDLFRGNIRLEHYLFCCYNKPVEIEFDPAKDAANRNKHGLSLADATRMDIAAVVLDDRQDYGEVRFRAYGLIGERWHVLVYTKRGETRRLISLRKANDREVKRYGKEK